MVRFVDLGEDGIEDAVPRSGGEELTFQWEEGRANPNYSHGLSIVLSCYPVVSQLARYVDTNTLHELSRACRQIRANLLQHRKSLIKQTLRCSNEDTNPAHRLGEALNASFERWTTFGRNGTSSIGRVSGGKVTACTRDMVGECRRCGQNVCRNCVIKAPSIRDLKNRHRRLCRTCMKSPLDRLTVGKPIQLNDSIHSDNEGDTESVQYARDPCYCEKVNVWICHDCGQGLRSAGLRSADTTYLRGWAWRTRYSACGGVGAGLGQGNEGVECGRKGDCLVAKEVEKEIECDADELAALKAEMEKLGNDGRKWAGSSYMTCEMVGIGGKVKKKLKQEVLVGAIVKEYEDERVNGKFLRREQEGSNRSWCSWCARVVPGKKDGEHSSSLESLDTPVSSAPHTPSVHADAVMINPLRIN